jgi:hypothetical protein
MMMSVSDPLIHDSMTIRRRVVVLVAAALCVSFATLLLFSTWPNEQLHSQILLYRRFVSFWMEKFLGNDANRIYLSYEELMEQDDVPDEAIRLATFLHDGIQSNTVEMMDMFGGSIDDHSIAETTTKAMARMVRLEDVPCLWKSVVHHHRGVGDEYNYNWVWSQKNVPIFLKI